MICPMGGFPTIRHNELRDITASLLSEVCHNVATEPRLQPLNGESMTHRTAITTDDARLDPFPQPTRSMRTSRNGHMANAFVTSSIVYSHHLFFHQPGGMGNEATTFYKRLADMMSWKQQKPYSVVINWLRCRLSFAAIRSSFYAYAGQGLQAKDPYVMLTSPLQHLRASFLKFNLNKHNKNITNLISKQNSYHIIIIYLIIIIDFPLIKKKRGCV